MEKEMEKLIKERIEENKSLFTDDELLQIKKDYSILIKIYLLGLLDKNA